MPCWRKAAVRFATCDRSTQKAIVDLRSAALLSQARTVSVLISSLFTAFDRAPVWKSPAVDLTRERSAPECTVVKITSESHLSSIMST